MQGVGVASVQEVLFHGVRVRERTVGIDHVEPRSMQALHDECEFNIHLRLLVYLVIFDSGWVSLEHLLLSWYPSRSTTNLTLILNASGSDRPWRGGGVPSAIASTVRRFRENMALIRQSRPDFGLGFKVKALDCFSGEPFRCISRPVRKEFQ